MIEDMNLKPCPFCGSSGENLKQKRIVFGQYQIQCKECGATGPEQVIEENISVGWNTRPKVKP